MRLSILGPSLFLKLEEEFVYATPLRGNDLDFRARTHNAWQKRFWYDDAWCHVKTKKIASPYKVIC